MTAPPPRLAGTNAAALVREHLAEARAAGLNIKQISTYMGHASVNITLDRYGHLFPSSGDEAIKRMDAYFERATS